MVVQYWVTVYDCVQRFGGSEEGGWYYWTGIPEWSQSGWCHCEDDGEHASHCPISHFLNEARIWIAGFKPGYLDSFLSGDTEESEYRGEGIYGDKEIRIETHTGHAFPDHPPHYE